MAERVFQIQELVEAICEAVIVYTDEEEEGYFGFAIDFARWTERNGRRTLVELTQVNKFVGAIADRILWREPKNGLIPFLNLFSEDLDIFPPADSKFKRERSSTPEDFELFLQKSEFVRYLCLRQDEDRAYQCEYFLREYRAHFPSRPIFPHLRALICPFDSEALLHVLHPTVISLQINRDSLVNRPSPITPLDFQRRAPNLVWFRDMVVFPDRDMFSEAHSPVGTQFQRETDAILHQWPLTHLEVVRYLVDLPYFFTIAARLLRLDHLKIIAVRHDKFTVPPLAGLDPNLDVFHTASILEIEGEIADLHQALRLCSPGKNLTRVSLLHYMNGMATPLTAREFFILPPHLSRKPLEAVMIDWRDNGEDIPNGSPEWTLPSSAFSSFTAPPHRFTKLDLRIPYCVPIDSTFLRLVATSQPMLEHFVLLRSDRQSDTQFRFTTLSFREMLQFAISLPKLHHLGLESDTRSGGDGVGDDGSHLQTQPSVVFTHMVTLEVGASPINNVEIVAKACQQLFPNLRRLLWESGPGYRKPEVGIDGEVREVTSTRVFKRWTYEFARRWKEVAADLDLEGSPSLFGCE